MPKVTVKVIFVAVLFVILCSVEARHAFADSSVNPPYAAVTAPPKYNGITTLFADAGARTCLGRMNQITNYLSQGAQAGAYAFIPPNETNLRLLSTSVEARTANDVFYTTAPAAPTPNGACGALYETVDYWPAACQEVATKAYPQLRPERFIQQVIQVLDGGDTLKIFLMPAGQNGCVAIKKEVLY